MLARGEVSEVPVEGRPGRWLVLTRDLPALARAARAPLTPRGTTLLAPFDSLLWYRDRVARLFGFDYRIEVYTPGHQRVHGYYTLPILHDGQLIGRVDAKTHRAERRLEVRHVHIEPWAAAGSPPPGGERMLDVERALAGVAEALQSLGAFVAGDDLTLGRVTPRRLHAPLRRALVAAAPTHAPARAEPGRRVIVRPAAARRASPRPGARSGRGGRGTADAWRPAPRRAGSAAAPTTR
jgi:hypothetical protein